MSLVPELVRLIAGDKAGKVASAVEGAVKEITGTSDPAIAETRAKLDPSVASQLRTRLAEIALEAQKAQDAAAEQKRQAALATMKAEIEDTVSARTMTVGLAQAGSSIAWGAPIVSIIVTLGFFALLALLLIKPLAGIDPVGAQILNIAIGALTTGFATVISYWLGSSKGSLDREETVRQLSRVQATQTQTAVNAITDVARKTAPTVIEPLATVIPAAPLSAPDNFEKCVAVVFAQEGGYSNRPTDPGGPTNLGITILTLADWRGHPVTADDVKNLTQNEAKEIYRTKYWNVARCYDLPAGLDLSVFDMGVNSGPRTSVKILQRLVGVTDDGSVGPMTLSGVQKFKTSDLVLKFAEARLAYYKTLPGWAENGNGWGNRVARVRAAALAMV